MAGPPQTLLLVPTETERAELVRIMEAREERAELKLCGFGPVTAAVGAAGWIVETSPQRVLLLGLAGAFDVGQLPLGTATLFNSTALDGVGAGTGSSFRSAAELGFATTETGRDDNLWEHDQLPLAVAANLPRQSQLLTCCAAAASPADVASRKQRFPTSAAEDMEAFGVALACRRFGVPLAVVRGISNAAGDRRHAEWQISAALGAAWQLAQLALREPHWELNA